MVLLKQLNSSRQPSTTRSKAIKPDRIKNQNKTKYRTPGNQLTISFPSHANGFQTLSQVEGPFPTPQCPLPLSIRQHMLAQERQNGFL